MRRLALAATLLATPALAVSPAATAQRYAAALNTDDTKTANALLAPSIAITDEFPPFHWQGTTAATDWLAGFGKLQKQQAITDQKITTAAPIREEISGDNAYVILPATYDYREAGQPRHETARWTFTLTRTGADWKITAWTWTAPRATP